jgi:SAM-dependent methyltransferase
MKSSRRKQYKTYDRTAAAYHEKDSETSLCKKKMDKFLGLVDDLNFSVDRILDYGCGTGRDAAIFSDKGYLVTGMDPSSGMIEVAQEVCT